MPKTIELKILTRDDLPTGTVDAVQLTADNRLAAHPEYYSDDSERPESRKIYTVTHIASGKGMGLKFPSKRVALEFCESIGERVEWDSVGPRGGVSGVPRYFRHEVGALLRAVVSNVLR